MTVSSRSAAFGRPLSSETISVPGSGVSSAPTVPAAARNAVASVSGVKVRWRSDGVNPSSTVGHPIDVDGYAEFGRADLASLLFHSSDGATPGSVFITYYGE